MGESKPGSDETKTLAGASFSTGGRRNQSHIQLSAFLGILKNKGHAIMDLIQNYISTLQLTMDQLPRQLIAEVIDVLQQARRQGNQVFILGNGGSASTASHFACDLAKN